MPKVNILSAGKLKIHIVTVGMLEENCYIVCSEGKELCVLVDPGDNAKFIVQTMKDTGVNPCAILLTHGHFDHLGAVAGLLKEYQDLPVYAHTLERTGLELTNANKIMRGRTLSLDDINYLDDGAILDLVGEDWRLIHTPGHSGGSVCYYIEKEKLLFSGDTLFQGSCGRTDFPTGSMNDIVDSIQHKLMSLPDETLVLPGHGEKTTIGIERRSNFIMQM